MTALTAEQIEWRLEALSAETSRQLLTADDLRRRLEAVQMKMAGVQKPRPLLP